VASSDDIRNQTSSHSVPDEKRIAALHRREVALVAAGSIGFALMFGYPVLRHLNYPGAYRDWDLFREMAWVTWNTVVNFHQLPVWNPYLCGGIPMIGDPQSSFFTPLFLLHLLFGPVVGIHLEIFAHLAIGWAGGYVLARAMSLGTLAAIACATIFPASSWFSLHVAVGHHVFMPACYLPWVLALALCAIDRRRLGWASIAGLCMGLIFLEGAPHATSFGILLLAVILTPQVMIRRDAWPLLVIGIVLTFGAGFAAVKLWPTYEFLAQHPRLGYLEHFPMRDLTIALFDPKQEYRRPGLTYYGFFEAGAYLSPFFLGLAVLGAVMRWRRNWPWSVAGIIMFALAMGSFSR
jgi:hypothetical protein